ncbi:threonylcarbamoyl-AMP synthase [Gemella sp. GH3]|nr:threonylcarbamoyl-AMP synthase [Gemella sp. GH3.1]NYS50146.1 threonylcarbamoyl-AMP synthase [Gemella sp. GH3]
MKTEIIEINIDDNQIFEKLKDYYKKGKLVAIPTETVYGLSADATNDKGTKNIYKAKGRPSDNPLIVHFAKLEQLDNIVSLDNENVKKLISAFWPGPMTVILPIINKGIISKNVTAGLDTLAVRMPKNKVARLILEKTNVLLAAPSANTSGKPSPTKFEHVYNDLNGKIDVIIKSEISELGLESTVIDCTKYPFAIVRPGSITKDDIEKVLGEGSIYYNNQEDVTKIISPGMKYRHYSPDADLIIYTGSEDSLLDILKNKGSEIGFITYENMKNKLENFSVNIKYLADSEENIEECNKNLYNILREYDNENVEKIYILDILETDKSKALVNRLRKASSKK